MRIVRGHIQALKEKKAILAVFFEEDRLPFGSCAASTTFIFRLLHFRDLKLQVFGPSNLSGLYF